MDRTMVWVFVYGTLKQGGTLHTGAEEEVLEDTITGTLYNLGPYPAIKLEGEGEIKGELHLIDEAYLPAYDRIEGVSSGFYRRERVTTASGIEAFVYEIVQDLPTTMIHPTPEWTEPSYRRY